MERIESQSENLTDHQRQAIVHKDGPALILAGPGSGKTMVITYRVRHLIQTWKVNPANILVITFTRAAAEEMQERFERLMDGAGRAVTFGTFHSVFFYMLRMAYRYDAGNILRGEEKMRIMQQLLSGEKLDLEDMNEFSSGILEDISRFKNSRLTMAEFEPVNTTSRTFQKLYQGYEQALQKWNKIDFDDMLLMTYDLLSQRPDICQVWQKKYRYILIDEFQDINQVQYDVVRLLAGTQQNLFVVGDDDQSIYGFRGSRPEIMIGFQKDYPQAVQILLDRNFRSAGNIVKAAENLIVHNQTRYEKQIQPEQESGSPVSIIECQNIQMENQELLDKIRLHVQQGVSYEEMAILYRTNTAAGPVIEKLMEHHLPFQVRDQVKNLFEHWIARDMLAYLDMAEGDLRRSTVLQVMNRPNRYIHREALNTETVSFSQLKDFYKDKDWMQERIVSLEKDLQLLSKMRPYAAMNYIRKGMGYDSYIAVYAEYRNLKTEEFYEILDNLMESARECATLQEWKSHIAAYTRTLQEQTKKRSKEKEGITLTTIHSAKGLEYEVVFVVDVNEEVIPHHKAVEEADLEEERRLFYVAVTRARHYLYLLYTKERYHKKTKASRYLYELTEVQKGSEDIIEMENDLRS